MRSHFLPSLKEHWDEVLNSGQPLTFKKGQVLFYEGHSPYGLFVLQKGKVQFQKGGCPYDQENLWQTPMGILLGYQPFREGRSYCCTCRAAEECEVLFISKTLMSSCLGIKLDR